MSAQVSYPVLIAIDGSKVKDRVKRHGVECSYVGENIGYKRVNHGSEVAISLVIDDKTPSRGHRDNIFNPEYKYIGVGIAPHEKYHECIVIDYAGELKDGAKGSSAKASSGSSKPASSKPVKAAGEEVKSAEPASTGEASPKNYTHKSTKRHRVKADGKTTQTTTITYTFEDGTTKVVSKEEVL